MLGDYATVSVTGPPTVASTVAASTDDDPMLEDLDGDGESDVFDAMVYYNNRDSATIMDNPGLFDGDGQAGTIFDAIALYEAGR